MSSNIIRQVMGLWFPRQNVNLAKMDEVIPFKNPSMTQPRFSKTVIVGLLAALGGLLAVQLLFSLQWRMVHDSAYVQYLAFAMDRLDLVLYRDLHETVLPVTVLIQLASGKLMGYSDLAFRITDVVWLLALLGVSYAIMRPFGWPVATAAPVLFGLIYLSYGPIISFQRDFTGLLPIALALLLATSGKTVINHLAIILFLIGVLFGIAIGIKPHLVLGLPAIFLLALTHQPGSIRNYGIWNWRKLIASGLVVSAGIIIVLVLQMVWVWSQGAALPFLNDMVPFFPLYGELTGQFKILAPTDRLIYLFNSFQNMGGKAVLLVPVAAGAYFVFSEVRLSPAVKRTALALIFLTAVYAFYPVIAGKFWTYHWLPYMYFATMSGALVLLPLTYETKRASILPATVLVWTCFLVLVVRPAPDFFRQLRGDPPRAPRGGRVDEIANFLKREMRPGDTVQPIDFVSGGVVQAMLLAEATPATPYMSVPQMTHHISTEPIQRMRSDFLARLYEAQPRFIVDYPDRPRPTGTDTELEFAELVNYMAQEYETVYEGSDFVIYERTQ